MTDKPIRAFLSYAWTSEDHKRWVRELAERLVGDHVDVVLDQWDLQPGHDTYAFMERIVNDPDVSKVIIVCDRAYVQKANKRKGGVGTETQIISPELYSKASDQNRFVVVSREIDDGNEPCRPTYYKSRLCIPMVDDEAFEFQYEELLRWVYGKPLRKRPDLGAVPKAILEDRAVDGVSARPVENYLTNARRGSVTPLSLNSALEASVSELRAHGPIPPQDGVHIDDVVWAEIESLLPLSNRICELFKVDLASGRSIDELQPYLRFLEKSASLSNSQDGWQAATSWSLDHQKFFAEEIFCRLFGCAIAGERFDAARTLVANRYVIKGLGYFDKARSSGYEEFLSYVESFDGRNRRLSLRRLSLKADLLRERCSAAPITFEDYNQGDFLLYLTAIFKHGSFRSTERWWPSSLLFVTHYYDAFPVFIRAESNAYANKLGSVLGVASGVELQTKLAAIPLDKDHVPQWEFDRIDLPRLSNLKNLNAFA